MIKKLYLFYPSKITGGAEYLMKRTAEILQSNFRITIIDYVDGWIINNINLPPKSFDTIIYTEGQKIETVDDGILITAAIYLRNIDRYFQPSQCSIVFWTMQPYNLIPFFPVLKNSQRKHRNLYSFFKGTLLFSEFSVFNKLISLAIQKKSLYAMDEECNNILKEYFGLTYTGYLPVFIDQKKFIQPDPIFNSLSKVKVVWLGRLDLEFKYSILQRVIEDVQNFAARAGTTIVFSVIGNGPGKERLLLLAQQMKNIKFCFLGELHDSSLTSALEDCHFAFAMGTSAIETSARKIPTILLDFSYGPVAKSYRYRWFYESSNYTLGRDIYRFREKSCGNQHKIDDVFTMVKDDRNQLAEKCFKYAIEFHSQESLKLVLLNAIKCSTLKIIDLYSAGVSTKPFWHLIRPFVIKSKICIKLLRN